MRPTSHFAYPEMTALQSGPYSGKLSVPPAVKPGIYKSEIKGRFPACDSETATRLRAISLENGNSPGAEYHYEDRPESARHREGMSSRFGPGVGRVLRLLLGHEMTGVGKSGRTGIEPATPGETQALSSEPKPLTANYRQSNKARGPTRRGTGSIGVVDGKPGASRTGASERHRTLETSP